MDYIARLRRRRPRASGCDHPTRWGHDHMSLALHMFYVPRLPRVSHLVLPMPPCLYIYIYTHICMCVHSLEVVARPLSLTRQGIESKKGPSGSRADAAGRKVPCHGGLRPNTSCRFVSVSSLCASPPSNAEPPTPCSQSLHMSTLDPFPSEWLCFSIKLGNGQSG